MLKVVYRMHKIRFGYGISCHRIKFSGYQPSYKKTPNKTEKADRLRHVMCFYVSSLNFLPHDTQ